MYNLVGDWASSSLSDLPTNEAVEKPKTLLLDVCCGTGTIGICLSNKVDKVFDWLLIMWSLGHWYWNLWICCSGCSTERRVESCWEFRMDRFSCRKGFEWFIKTWRSLSYFISYTDMIWNRIQEYCCRCGSTSWRSSSWCDYEYLFLLEWTSSALRKYPLIKSIIYISCNPTGSFIDNLCIFNEELLMN